MANNVNKFERFLKRHVFRVKYHFLYAALAQIVVMGINVLTFVSMNLKIPTTVFHTVVPTYFYLIFITLFYLLNYKMNRRITRQSLFSKILIVTIVAVNVIYIAITTVDESGWMYYLDTVIIQTINALYIMIYITANGRQFTQGRQLNLLRVFGYVSAVVALLAFYFSFDDPMVMWGLVVATTAMLFGTYMIFHENLKKTLPKKKHLVSRAQNSLKNSKKQNSLKESEKQNRKKKNG
ncbi:MAG: hypothetical protein IKW04_03525 [Clostridia bacterium]|nr:hypothetical protein [Clostridia bacterium]